MDYVKKIEELKRKTEEYEKEKIRSEERLKTLQEEQNKLIEEMLKYNVNPGNISEVIEELELEINQEITKIETQLAAINI